MSDLTIQGGIHHGTYGTQEKARTRPKEGGFADVIKQAVERVNDMEQEADRSVQQLVTGKAGIHETMIALQKADISLRLLLQIRNKAMDAYREVMRMQF
jgi:flagellar hook-basal body complex protein FliE